MASETSTSNMVSQTHFQMPSSFAACSGASATQGCFPRLLAASHSIPPPEIPLPTSPNFLRPPHALSRLLVVFFGFLQSSELLALQHSNALWRSEGYHLLSSKMVPSGEEPPSSCPFPRNAYNVLWGHSTICWLLPC